MTNRMITLEYQYANSVDTQFCFLRSSFGGRKIQFSCSTDIRYLKTVRNMDFDIKRSNKSHINSDEHYIVTANGVVYLRAVGAEGSYVVMTATADEDSKSEVSCPLMVALNEAALRTANSFNLEPTVKSNFKGREYVELCQCDYLSDVFRLSERLFSHFKDYLLERPKKDLQELYPSLTIDESGDDVYLSDELWLASDGTISGRSPD